MDYIAQQHAMSCGVACVANVANISYAQALSLFDSRYADTRGYHCKNIVDAMRQLGKYYRFCKVIDSTRTCISKDGSIVFIGESSDYPYGHYLARVGESWVDPWINLVEDGDIGHARAGKRDVLPGVAMWVIYRAD